MKISFESLARLGLGLLIALTLIGVVVWVWVIPAVIRAAIRDHYDGDFVFQRWWIGRNSAGVTGLTLHEGRTCGLADLGAHGLGLTPTSPWVGCCAAGSPRAGIVFRHPSIQYRIDAQGNPLTPIALRGDGTTPPELWSRTVGSR